MTKSDLARTFDSLQKRLEPLLRDSGFQGSSRTYNRTTADGLTHVIGFQMGRSDPPGTTHIPGLRENLYGLFAINLGVYVPEVARYHGGGEPKSAVRDANCCIPARLSRETPTQWWKISDDEALSPSFGSGCRPKLFRYSNVSKTAIRSSMNLKRRAPTQTLWPPRESFAPSFFSIAATASERVFC